MSLGEGGIFLTRFWYQLEANDSMWQWMLSPATVVGRRSVADGGTACRLLWTLVLNNPGFPLSLWKWLLMQLPTIGSIINILLKANFQFCKHFDINLESYWPPEVHNRPSFPLLCGRATCICQQSEVLIFCTNKHISIKIVSMLNMKENMDIYLSSVVQRCSNSTYTTHATPAALAPHIRANLHAWPDPFAQLGNPRHPVHLGLI